jgi:hypothetical protein
VAPIGSEKRQLFTTPAVLVHIGCDGTPGTLNVTEPAPVDSAMIICTSIAAVKRAETAAGRSRRDRAGGGRGIRTRVAPRHQRARRRRPAP